ncbi:hypothetical protein ACR77V_12815 [Staphylococcus epidermidis]|uniref:hypothetical protein n=1 Tax=Staphylococcus epidermidis TaxID=1282 RepID=UPI003DA2A34C
MEIRLDSLKSHIDETIHREIEDVKKNFIEAMRADILVLQTYKLFSGEGDTSVKRDEVMKIFKKYTEGDEGNGSTEIHN